MKRDKIDDVLKVKLRDYEPQSGVPSWEAMRRRMVLADNASGAYVSRRRRNTIMHYGIAAAVLVALSLGVYLSTRIERNKIKDTHQQAASMNGTVTGNGSVAASATTANASADIIEKILGSAHTVAIVDQTNIPTAGNAPSSYEPVPATIGNNDGSGGENATAPLFSFAEGSSTHEGDNTGEYIARNGGYMRNETGLISYARNVKRGSEGWQLGAYVNGSGAAASRNSNSPRPSVFGSTNSSALMEVNYVNNVMNITMSDLKHKYPISVGLNVRKNITQRFGLETGVVYSYLESTAELPSSGYTYKRKQQLHYLGIPLYLSYSMLNSNRWDFYVSGGGMAEWSLAARETTKIFYERKLSDEDRSSLPASGLLWSVGATLGLQYDFINDFGIYVEPGFSYYFENEDQPASYRSENPLMFNFRAGLRYKF